MGPEWMTHKNQLSKQTQPSKLKYLKRANRPKGRDAKLWGLRPQGYGSPAANISILSKLRGERNNGKNV